MNYANQLKQLLEKKLADEPLADVALPVPALGKDFIFHFKARRIDLSQTIMTGQLPEHIAGVLLKAGQAGNKPDSEEVLKTLTVEEQLHFIKLQRFVVQQVCADPVLVDKYEEGPNEVSLYKLPAELIQAIYTYGMELSPGVPVATTDGSSVSVADIESFRPQA